jgi:predicted nucleic acid-binding protein
VHELLDACVALNLLATRQLDAISRAIDVTFVMAQEAALESLYLEDLVDGVIERAVVDLQPHVSEGTLELWRIAGDLELETFVALAAQVDQGEAASLTLAMRRQLRFATDDRKARRVSRELGLINPDTTTAILRRYVDAAELSPKQVSMLLGAVERRASFRPSRRDPDEFQWWHEHSR